MCAYGSRQAGAEFDFPSAIALVCLLGPLSFALSNGESSGWSSAATLGALGVSAVAVVLLIVTSRRSDDPLIQLRYFRHPRFLMAATGMFVMGFTLFCFFVYFNVFVQSPDTFGYSPIAAGIAILPLSLCMFAVSVIAPRFLAPYSFQWPLIVGMGLAAVGFLLLTTTTNTTNVSETWWKLAIIGLGLGTGFALLPRLGLRLLPEEHTGQGSGVINAFLYFGATMGSVLGGLAEAITTRWGLSEVIAALPEGSTRREDLAHALTHGTPGQVQQLIAELDPDTGATLARALRDLQDNAFDSAMFVAAMAAVIAMVLAILLLRGPVPPVHSAADLVKR